MHEAEVLKGYLLHRGMNENDVNHYMQMNAQHLMGGGILDFFKKHKKAILRGLATAALAGVATVAGRKHYRNQKNRQDEISAMYDDFGGGGFFDWFNKHKETIYKVLSVAGKVGKKVYDLFAKNPKVDYIDV